jgi:hypothetical protein
MTRRLEEPNASHALHRQLSPFAPRPYEGSPPKREFGIEIKYSRAPDPLSLKPVAKAPMDTSWVLQIATT